MTGGAWGWRIGGLLLAQALLFALPASAQVTLRSGWHEGFTRLVLTLPPGSDYRLGRVAAGYAVDFDDPAMRIDTSGVFERIPADRLTGIEGADGRLTLELGCDCHLTGFRWREDRLVLDIRDGAAPSDAPFEVPLDPVAILPLQGPDSASAPAEAPATLPETVPSPDVLPLMTDRAPPAPDPLLDTFAPEPGAGLSEAEQAILESVARAATQGLIDAGLATAPTRAPAPDEDAPEPEPAEPPDTVAGPGMPGVTASTSVDRALAGLEDILPRLNESGSVCLDPAAFDLAAWADDRPFGVQLADLRAALTAEFDRVPEGAAGRLARFYLHMGFGAEARQALAMEPGEDATRAPLAAIAALLDGEPADPGVLSGQLDCPGPVALWALLARDAIPPGAEMDRNGILQAFRALPPPVQGAVATGLADRFIAAGDTEAATLLLGTARTAPGGETPDTELARADLAVRQGETEETLRQLIARAREDRRAGADLLLRIADLSHAEGRALPEDILDLFAVVRFEQRGTEDAPALVAAEVRARSEAGGHAAALALIGSSGRDLAPEQSLSLASAAVERLTAEADDVTFLGLVLPGLPPVSAGAENTVARRLLDLGFADRALAALRTPARQEAAAERRYLEAEAHLALGAPEEVDRVLAGITSPRAGDIRARALAASGDHAAAFAANPAPPQERADPGAAWRAGAFERLARSGDAELRAASDMALDSPRAVREATLSQSREILDAAAESRNRLDSLLARFPLDPEEAPDE